MADYIDRETLREKMYREAFETDSDLQKWDSGCWIRYKLFENVLASIPTADVVTRDCFDRLLAENDELREERPVRHGRWTLYSPFTDTFECDKCGYQVIDESFRTNYCPNCGADMRGADDDR